tara:strand:+ start:336 stop:638 length:303 start_codon:yes stop_codon:yes gene_type:complete
MPRPIKLVKKDMLEEAYDLHLVGVPTPRIIKNKQLKISNPHLHVLLDHYKKLATNINGEDAYRIEKSLFPAWLEKSTDDVGIQDPRVDKYVGKMPYGEWI